MGKRMKIDLCYGAPVLCAGVKCGVLTRSAVNPNANRVTHLIVDEGQWRKTARAIPFTFVRLPNGDEIQLDLLPDALQSLPEYRPEVVYYPAPVLTDAATDGATRGNGSKPLEPISHTIHHGVPRTVLVLEQGIPVQGDAGTIGELNHFRVRAGTGAITHVVVRQGSLFITTRAIPIDLISAITPDSIATHATREQLRGIPERPVAQQI